MLSAGWLLFVGISVGLVTRMIAGGKAYGVVSDALFGITGAFAADWMLGVITSKNSMDWASVLFFTIWGAAACPALAHFVARRTARARTVSTGLPPGFQNHF